MMTNRSTNQDINTCLLYRQIRPHPLSRVQFALRFFQRFTPHHSCHTLQTSWTTAENIVSFWISVYCSLILGRLSTNL